MARTYFVKGIEATLGSVAMAGESIKPRATGERERAIRVRMALDNLRIGLGHRVWAGSAPLRPEHDLSCAVEAMVAEGHAYESEAAKYAFVGELSVSHHGQIRPIRGAAVIAMQAWQDGQILVAPAANSAEIAAMGATHIAVTHLDEVEDLLGDMHPPIHHAGELPCAALPDRTLDELNLPESLLDHVAGVVETGRGIMLRGSAGSGMTALARRLPELLGHMRPDEIATCTRIHSAAGLTSASTPTIHVRPFRAPHYSVSDAGLLGGGEPARPGEVSLAHGGVLYLDQLCEFRMGCLDALANVLRGREVSLGDGIMLPADPLVVASDQIDPSRTDAQQRAHTALVDKVCGLLNLEIVEMPS
jgi:magnesium chelatase family protein